jgi:hypothetical protein
MKKAYIIRKKNANARRKENTWKAAKALA